MSDKISFLTLALAKKGSGATKWLGVTTTELTDGASTNPITINGASVTAEDGDIVQYGTDTFTFNGEVWQISSMDVEVQGTTLVFN